MSFYFWDCPLGQLPNFADLDVENVLENFLSEKESSIYPAAESELSATSFGNKDDDSPLLVPILQNETETIKQEACEYLSKGQYFKCLQVLYKLTCFKRSFHRFVETKVRNDYRQVKNIFKKEKECSLEEVRNFSWAEQYSKLAKISPIFQAALEGAILNKAGERTWEKKNGEVIDQLPKLGMIFSITLFNKYPTSFSLVQNMNNLILYNEGLVHKWSLYQLK